MLVTKLRMDGQVFYLPDTTDIALLKSEIVDAARGGAAFIEFDTHDHGQVAVLMTAHMPVRFETVDCSDEEVAGWEDEPPSFDFDAAAFDG